MARLGAKTTTSTLMYDAGAKMSEVTTQMRYEFGKNWAEFVENSVDENTIEASQRHLTEMLRTDDLSGRTFLDIGCGSGIHSLAALRMGAERVISFDYDW